SAAITLAAASFAVGAAALTPAMANYAPCVENPAAKGCPGEIKQPAAMQSYKGRGTPDTPHNPSSRLITVSRGTKAPASVGAPFLLHDGAKRTTKDGTRA